MKWINLADRKPSSLAEAIVRKVKTPRREPALTFESYRYNDNGTIYLSQGHYGDVYQLNEFEWLDESKENIIYEEAYLNKAGETPKDEDYYPKIIGTVCNTTEGVPYIWNGEKWILCLTQEEVDKLLKEQHRNTRHDAAEAVMGYIVDTDCFLDSATIHSLVMNLKQRKP